MLWTSISGVVLAGLKLLFTFCEEEKRLRELRQIAQSHGYCIAKLGLEPRLIQFQSLWF
jgi:hypothetical protein